MGGTHPTGMHSCLIIQLYIFINFAVCGDGFEMDTTNEVCVCAVDFYQTAPGIGDEPPQCTACPAGSTTNGNSNSQDISACGMKF